MFYKDPKTNTQTYTQNRAYYMPGILLASSINQLTYWSQSPLKVDTILGPILQMEKWKQRKIE